MPTSILVAYATSYGSTQEVAEAIAGALRESGLSVTLQAMHDVQTVEGYSALVLGAPLYMYRWHKDARRFLAQHRAGIMTRPVAIFTLGPCKDDAQEWQEVREQLDKELAQHPWLAPIASELFGGKFDPSTLRFPMNLVPGLQKMPASDIRDWAAIRAWALKLAAQLQPELAHAG